MYTTRIPDHRNKSRQAVSAGREPRYERPSNVSVLPQKLFNARVSLATVCPETALMYAVLEDALLCFHEHFGIENPRIKRTAQRAEDWFFRPDSRWLFSFVSICTVLGLEPEYIRKKLKHWSQSRLDTRQRKM